MTSMSKTSRSSFVRQGRTQKTRRSQPGKAAANPPARRTYQSTSAFLNAKPRQVKPALPARKRAATKRQNYDLAFSLGDTHVHAPALTMPHIGSRWISICLAAMLIFFLYSLSTASTFTIASAELIGNQRLSVAEVNAVLSAIGQPIIKAIPSQLAADLQAAYSELESVQVQVRFPNKLVVQVVERTPLIAWYQDGAVTWIDTNGIAFTPRGEVTGLLPVTSSGTPLDTIQDESLPPGTQRFLSPEMVSAIFALAPEAPSGTSLLFDPIYGIGWQDPRGWTTFFGKNAQDIPMKKLVYTSILDSLNQKGIQPSLVSVEYLDAPFYK
jgi:cell division protein FtsQ